MRELTKALGSFSWAMSLFGARQMLDALQPGRAAASFDAVTRETERQLDDTLRSTFRMGDQLQRSFVDLAFGMMGFDALDPRRWTDAASRMAGDASQAANRATGGMTGAAWQATGGVAEAARRATGGFAEAARQATGAAADAVSMPRVPPAGSAAWSGGR